MDSSLPERRSFLRATTSAALGLSLKPALGQSQDLAALTLKEASQLLRSKAASPMDLTQACLKRIETYNPRLDAFITVTSDQALATAREMEAEQRRGKWRGPLHGIPIALKDNIDTAGIRTTAASGVFKDRVPTEDAEVVRRLKEAGAVLLGKLNMHEFAYGGTSDVSYFGAVHNPWALDHVSGGSSGGSAAAIAASLCFGSLGTDTGGSVRIPSSYCGVVGFKPTYGRVSLRGIIPLSWTLDHCGPICKTVEDAALMLQSIAGYDAMDPASVDVPVPDYLGAFRMETAKLRLGVPRSPFFENLDPEVAKAVESAIGVLRKLTKSVNETTVPAAGQFVLPILGPEAYAFHAKWIVASPNLYQPITRDMIIQLANVKSPAYAAALRQTNLLRRQIVKTFSTVDLLITPTMPHTAQTLAKARDFDPGGLQNTSPFDVLGLPTISVPCGFTNSGLPIGLQISGAPFAESTVLSLAHAYERATDWHKKHPGLTSGNRESANKKRG
jgi:aspartyl-tRNA(Asn)/glutamyl-tRNA(Gln) amidotransferase subunit A